MEGVFLGQGDGKVCQCCGAGTGECSSIAFQKFSGDVGKAKGDSVSEKHPGCLPATKESCPVNRKALARLRCLLGCKRKRFAAAVRTAYGQSATFAS